MPTGLVYDPRFKDHLTNDDLPEIPARYDAVLRGLDADGLLVALPHLKPRLATREDLLRCHTAAYLDLAQSEIKAGVSELSTGDAAVSANTWETAGLAAGAGLVALDELFAGNIKNAFCIVRPPGHHASANVGMGFCILNSIAIAARYAQAKYGVENVLIADWDVHHGNGTQDIFYEDPTVFFFSTHQHPNYPGTGAADEIGAGDAVGSTLNCPFPAGAGRDEILGAFENRLVPAMEIFKPDLILISAGFDSRIGDPLGDFVLTDLDFTDLTHLMMGLADKHCRGRLVSILEGGYNLRGLAKAAAAHVAALASIPPL
jgi:acetoin utilization deacetylase AcuC-like enzyme